MSEIKNSAYLDRLLQNAKLFGGENDCVVTAERFLYVVVGKIKEGEINVELSDASSFFEFYKINTDKFKDALRDYISNSKKATFIDNLYIQRKLYEAKISAGEHRKAEVTADILVHCILAEPSEPLKKIINSISDKNDDIVSGLSLSDLFGDDSKDDEFAQTLENVLEELKKAEEDGDNSQIEEVEVGCDENEADSFGNTRKELDGLVSDVKRIRKELKGAIFGQDNAINTFATGYFQANFLSMIDKNRKRPKATFLFAGPPGVGKTFLAEKAASALNLPFMRFDMSEYTDNEANLEFCGSDKVYKNGKEGNLTGFVAKNPECVLLFDEIEKAHISIIHLFLQLLDAGRLRDNFTDAEVSFSKAIVIMTTNAGRKLYEDSESGDFSSVSRKVIIKALQNDVNPETNVPYFPGAICSRFASGNVVMFNHIDRKSVV